MGETINENAKTLKVLSKECKFKTVSAEENKNDNIKDAFITGLSLQVYTFSQQNQEKSVALNIISWNTYNPFRTISEYDVYLVTSLLSLNVTNSSKILLYL